MWPTINRNNELPCYTRTMNITDSKLKMYTNWEKIGSGSFGTVYKVLKDGTPYAIKVIRTDILHESARSRLDQEIKAIQKISHPNVVKLVEHGSFNDNGFEYVYIVMNLIEGRTLTSFIGNVDESESKILLKSILTTLDSVHKEGVIHRDLKPENIMIDSKGEPIILDLGLAKLVDYTSITQTGERLGTYYYMSPEQITDSKSIDPRSDYFAVGVIAYELITGVLPYDATNLPALIDQIKSDFPKNPTLINPDLSNSFENVILRLLEKDSHRRFQSVEEIISGIDNEPTPAKSRLDMTPRFYLRMNHNDKGLIQESHGAGLVDRVVYAANYFIRNHPTVKILSELPDLVFATDPGTNRLSYSSFSKTKGLIDLPYSSGSAVDPINVDDLKSLDQVQDFVKKVIDYQVENGVNELCSPFFFARSPSDPWYGVNIKLLHESVAYRDEVYPDLPIWACICMNVDGWHDKKQKNTILNDYTRIEADGYQVYGDPITKSANLTQMYHYSDLLLTLQSSSGRPVVASRVNGIGLVLMAFGLNGVSSGAASLDNFKEEILSDKNEGYANDPRYYVSELLSMISLTKGTDTKIKAIKNTSLSNVLMCNCKYCEAVNSGSVVHSDIKMHFLLKRDLEIRELSLLTTERERQEWISNKVNNALDYESTLKKEGVKLGSMTELSTLRDLIVELKKRP